MDLFLECKDGYYNASCTAKCGNCDDGSVCQKLTGYCLKGCKTNYMYPLCQGTF